MVSSHPPILISVCESDNMQNFKCCLKQVRAVIMMNTKMPLFMEHNRAASKHNINQLENFRTESDNAIPQHVSVLEMEGDGGSRWEISKNSGLTEEKRLKQVAISSPIVSPTTRSCRSVLTHPPGRMISAPSLSIRCRYHGMPVSVG